MNRREVVTILAIIKMAYPNAYKDVSSDEREILYKFWEMQFKEVPYSTLEKALQRHIRDNKYPPTIADINEIIFDIKKMARIPLKSHYLQIDENEAAKREKRTPFNVGILLSSQQLKTAQETIDICNEREDRLSLNEWDNKTAKITSSVEIDGES